MDNLQQHIGIIGAMDSEVAHLKGHLSDATHAQWAGIDFYTGSLGGVRATVVKCGIGKVNAALCAQALVLRFGVTSIVNTGVAGSLDARIDIGDIVVSTDAVEHDFNVTPLGYERGQIPGLATSVFVADERLRTQAVRAVAVVAPELHAFEGRVASGDLFVSAAATKAHIVNLHGALCCEMEGAAIAHACFLMGVPFVVVRAISDKADGSSHMDYRTFEERAAEHCARIVEHMVAHLDAAQS